MGVNKPYWPVRPSLLHLFDTFFIQCLTTLQLQEMKRSKSPPLDSWRPSELPSYKGRPEGPADLSKNGSTPAPYEGHRWLPVRPPPDENYDISLSPASTLTFDAFGPGLNNWAAAAQIHYTFLQHLEQGDIWRYKFNTWDFAYQRLSINLFALRGRDIIDVFRFEGDNGEPFNGDDEHYLTVKRPSQVKRHVVVDDTGVAVHFAFRLQYTAHDMRGVAWTDLLKRYQLYAEEMICPNVNMNTSATKPSSTG
jgi:hypothetical protein